MVSWGAPRNLGAPPKISYPPDKNFSGAPQFSVIYFDFHFILKFWHFISQIAPKWPDFALFWILFSPWLKRFLKFYLPSCSKMARFRTFLNLFSPWLKKTLKFYLSSWSKMAWFCTFLDNIFTMVEENFEIVSFKLGLILDFFE